MNGFVHQALIYGSEQEFVDAALPFVRAGIENEEPTLVAVQAANVEALRDALGAEATLIDLRTVEEWYENATRTRMKFASWVEQRTASAARVRLIGEPPWPLSSEAGIRDWARHESVINVAFEGVPLTFACPYDTRVLPPDVIDHAGCTHPEILRADGVSASTSYAEPAEFCRRLNSNGDAPALEPTAQLDFDRGELPLVRRLVEREAADMGLARERAHDIVVAVNEIATNAVTHGSAAARLRIWRLPGELLCEVADTGPGIGDPLAGQLKPDLESPGGWGLWMARMMSDAVDISAGPSGTAISIRALTSA